MRDGIFKKIGYRYAPLRLLAMYIRGLYLFSVGIPSQFFEACRDGKTGIKDIGWIIASPLAIVILSSPIVISTIKLSKYLYNSFILIITEEVRESLKTSLPQPLKEEDKDLEGGIKRYNKHLIVIGSLIVAFLTVYLVKKRIYDLKMESNNSENER